MQLIYMPLAMMALAAYVNAGCSDITNCDSCVNPPLQCYTCKEGQTLKLDNTGCLDCPSNCLNCTTEDDQKTACLQCDAGFALKKDGTCTGKQDDLSHKIIVLVYCSFCILQILLC